MDNLIIAILIVVIGFLVWVFVIPAIIVLGDFAEGLKRVFGKKPWM